VPWLVTWDDHEVDNNYAGTRSESLDPNFARRRAAAYRAYFEHMPLRRRARPQPTRMVLRSRRDWGQLARLHVLDGPSAAPRRRAPHRGEAAGR
jgi:alkaline phosphatase D